MTRLRCYITAGAIAMALASSVRATTFRFDTDPFSGTTVVNNKLSVMRASARYVVALTLLQF